MNRKRLPAALLALALGAFGLVAWAVPSYQDALFARYPNAPASLANCVACHEGPSASVINAFAAAYAANGYAFDAALEAQDADGDGATNGAELTATPATSPGDPASKPAGTGSPVTPVTPTTPSANRTGLWWNPVEGGWGVSLNHQGDVIFAVLFSYDEAGAPLWLVMPAGARQADGITWTGPLLRGRGPAYNAIPFTPVADADLVPVGAMTVAFPASGTATLSYTVQGVTVTKAIQPQVFGTAAATCTTTTASRATTSNYQDLWWNPAERGWGLGIAHQNDTLFATLFSYDASGNPLWFVMSGGTKQADGAYLGTLYRTRGPAFHAQPFTPIGPADLTAVGTMRIAFTDGVTGTLNYTVDGASVAKSITRQVFASPPPTCSSPPAGTTPVPPVVPPVTLTCASCHTLPPTSGEHREHRARACSTCHGEGYTSTAVNPATHRNGIKEVLASIGWNATSRTCANACHGRESW